MLNKVAFTVYPARDIERGRAFYEGVLGLEVGSTAGKGQWIEYDLPGGGCFALTTFTHSEPSSTAGGMIAFEVEDLELLVGKVAAAGGKFDGDLMVTPVCKMRVCIDSEGNGLILHQLRR